MSEYRIELTEADMATLRVIVEQIKIAPLQALFAKISGRPEGAGPVDLQDTRFDTSAWAESDLWTAASSVVAPVIIELESRSLRRVFGWVLANLLYELKLRRPAPKPKSPMN